MGKHTKHVGWNRPSRYIIEFFNGPNDKGITVFSGSKLLATRFLEYESNTLLTAPMRSRADEFLWYFKSLSLKDLKEVDGVYWPLSNNGVADNGYYFLSLHKGRRVRCFQDS
jgi:hypothetical protein